MKENEYYNEIESYIKRNEINKRRRVLEENYDTLNNYWEIGRLIVELQNGESRAKYGESLVKKWSLKFTENYGKGYSYANLKRFKQFYLVFQKGAPVGRLSWTNIKILLPIKDENKRNYYINLCIEKNLSKRALEEEIKSNSYVVVELKLRKLKIEDKAQVEKYMKLIDDNLKEVHHNKTMGIIISKEQDKFVVNFVRKDNLIPLTYELINN